MEQALKKYFHYEKFRPGQKEIIQSIMAGQPTLGILSTGSGKSLCYQLPGYLLEGTVVIVSPLISLMEDQVANLQARGEKRVIALNSLLSYPEKRFILENLSSYKFIYLSPEMLLTTEVLEALRDSLISLFVVDEAHCISQWGMDFRPEYLQLKKAVMTLGQPLVLALTATATPKVKDDIKKNLFEEVKEIIYSADRPNIRLFVWETDDKLDLLRKMLNRVSGSGIIYCATRKQVEILYEELRETIRCGYYHGGLDPSERRLLQQQFVIGELNVLIATNAFGMGIDKKDIRYVVHYELPANLENYWQEIGRAGRDGQPSQAILLYQRHDERIHHYFQQQQQESMLLYQRLVKEKNFSLLNENRLFQSWWHLGEPHLFELLDKQNEIKKQQLSKMLGYIDTKGCRRKYLLQYFGEEKENQTEICCDNDGAELLITENSKGVESMATSSWQEILIKLFKK